MGEHGVSLENIENIENAEYTEKKRHYVKNIGFDNSNYDNLFGKRAFW